jgi:hypothetical protein
VRDSTHRGGTGSKKGGGLAIPGILPVFRQAASMGASRVFRHENYELHCSACAVDNGKFVPAIVVTKQIWPTRPRIIAVRSGTFATEETAIEAARTQGIEWIASYG